MIPWNYIDTGEIIDSEDLGLIASLEETVSEEDGLVMAASRELFVALEKLVDRCSRYFAAGALNDDEIGQELEAGRAAVQQARGGMW
jgi:hypothetical protein